VHAALAQENTELLWGADNCQQNERSTTKIIRVKVSNSTGKSVVAYLLQVGQTRKRKTFRQGRKL